ncbi:putative Asparagine synthase [Giardia muris]|uniref:Putative Asparagine synthase n=1 Tax=Giardia muris TaxID=5742 RepID=A0A4Z1SXD5_GIAMU|nr:putative Asparagine synthase [Giardia muris]|eukprot:TNJ30366.1 putative Asparagine synthase [Giardia muris]
MLIVPGPENTLNLGGDASSLLTDGRTVLYAAPVSLDEPEVEKTILALLADEPTSVPAPFYFLVLEKDRSAVTLVTDLHGESALVYSSGGIDTRDSTLASCYDSEYLSDLTTGMSDCSGKRLQFIAPGRSVFRCVEGQVVLTEHKPPVLVPLMSSDPEPAVMLIASLENALLLELRGASQVAVLLSGGVDSALIGYALLGLVHRGALPELSVTLANVSFGAESPDRTAFETLRADAEPRLGGSWVSIDVSSDEFLAALPRVARATWPCSSTVMAMNLASVWYHAIRGANSPIVLSGLGPDEYCGAYARARASTAWKDAIRAARAGLFERNIRRDAGVAAALGVWLRYPLLTYSVASLFAGLLETDPAQLQDKRVVRDAARLMGVPESIAARPKRAAQFGSGCARILRGDGYELVAPALLRE